MDPTTFHALLSPGGQEALLAAQELQPQEADFLQHFTALSRRFPPELARGALEIAITRLEAGSKFPFAERLYFTQPALEQASSYAVSMYRMKRFRDFDLLFDLGCSVGGDTIALATLAPTIGVDIDPLRLAMAKANLEALKLYNSAAFVRTDLTSRLPFSDTTHSHEAYALYFDPARRRGERRARSIHDYHPPLDIVNQWLPRFPALGVKISPGVNLDELHAFDAELEFISLRGELKEAVLWFGPLKTTQRRATVLPGPHTFSAPEEMKEGSDQSSRPGGDQELTLPLSKPRAYIYEPDPSILRAGLVQALGVQLEAAQLDPDIAYLTSDRLAKTPFARAWEVETWLPFGIKRLREDLRQRGVNRVVVKKRGSPLQPEELIQLLRLKGGQGKDAAERVLFLTHLRGRPIVVVCQPREVFEESDARSPPT